MLDLDSSDEEVEKPVSVSDAIHALELLHIFDSQQEVSILMEPGIAQTLEHLRCRLLRQRLIMLGKNKQTTIDRYFGAVADESSGLSGPTAG